MRFIHHVGHRDTYRKRVYEAETLYWSGTQETVNASECGLITDLISDVMKLERPEIVHKQHWTAGGGSAGYNWDHARRHSMPVGMGVAPPEPVVSLYGPGRTAALSSLLHELAHHVMFNHVERDTTASHGAQFCAAHCWVLALWISEEAGDRMASHYRLKRAPVYDWRTFRDEVTS